MWRVWAPTCSVLCGYCTCDNGSWQKQPLTVCIMIWRLLWYFFPCWIAGYRYSFSHCRYMVCSHKRISRYQYHNVQKALNIGNWGVDHPYSHFLIGLVYFILPGRQWYFPRPWVLLNGMFWRHWRGSLVGTLMSAIITEYYTAMGKRPVNSIIRQSQRVMPPTLLVAWRLEWNQPSRLSWCWRLQVFKGFLPVCWSLWWQLPLRVWWQQQRCS